MEFPLVSAGGGGNLVSPDSSRGYDLAIDDSVGGKITESLGDLRESLVEVLVIPRVEDSCAACFDSDSAIAV